MKRAFLSILTFIICTSLFINVATAANISPRWTYISNIEGSIDYSGTAGEYWADISCASNVDNIVGTASLYYKNSSGRWVWVTDWTEESEDNTLLIEGSFNAVSGRKYKVTLDVTAYVDNSSESTTYTLEKMCP